MSGEVRCLVCDQPVERVEIITSNPTRTYPANRPCNHADAGVLFDFAAPVRGGETSG